MVETATGDEFEPAFMAMAQQRAGAMVISDDPFFQHRAEQLAALTVDHKMPAVAFLREFPVAGGLMSYGSNSSELHREMGEYTARILKGTKPADPPIMQPTKFELVINLKTAKALGIEVPVKLLTLADEVIE